MLVKKFPLTTFQQNTRIVACEETRRAICIDPASESDEIVQFIEANDLNLQAIALTHGHLDHIGGTLALSKSFPEAEILLHQDDEDLYFALPKQPLAIGIPELALENLGMKFQKPPPLTRNWIDGEIYTVGNLRFKILHCPGHTRGHVVLAEEQHQKVFVGDCLFAGSIGRTDLPGGDYDQLIDSINRNILSLGDDFIVYSGHGFETSVGQEKTSNPFLNGNYEMGKGRFL